MRVSKLRVEVARRYEGQPTKVLPLRRANG
jgi:hypothetical protein